MSKYAVTVTFEAFDDANAVVKAQALQMVTGSVFESPSFELRDEANKPIAIPSNG